jgi:hypothetical protein
MRRFTGTFVLVTVALVGICSTAAFTQTIDGAIRGAVTDDSGGVLPGVTVVATAVDRRVVGTAVSDAKGGYSFRALPAGVFHLTFQLDGFSTTVVEVAVHPGVESLVVERLKVAPVAETVVVIGSVPLDPSSAAFRLAAPPPPEVVPVPVHDRDSICGPAKPNANAGSFGTIRSGKNESDRQLYTNGDELVIDGGTLNGLQVGRNLVVRRYYRAIGGSAAAATGEHTAGLLQIVAADERVSKALVVYACDELMQGDFLASFEPEPLRAPDPVAGAPAFDDAARILFADAGQMLGVPRRLMVIDRGSDRGLRVGQRLTLFRPRARGIPTRSIVGDAVVVAIRIDSATIRVERATDAIVVGDWAAASSR